MRLAILSDLHSNPFALRAVLPEIQARRPDLVLCAGDVFGYYPWAQETYELFRSLDPVVVLGNHDRLVLETLGLAPASQGATNRPVYYGAAEQNGLDLAPAAREWLRALPVQRELLAEGWRVRMTHGTPADPLEGRLYPDDHGEYAWLPGDGEILVLGHTHHPVRRRTKTGGLVINPGSVGQPRQGTPHPTWIFLELTAAAAGEPELVSAEYSPLEPMEELARRHWPTRFIAALNKTTPGPLSILDGAVRPGGS